MMIKRVCLVIALWSIAVFAASCPRTEGRKGAVIEPIDLELKADIEVPGPGACHVQGITVSRGYLFVSCVERAAKKAWLYRYRLGEEFAETVLSGPETLEVTRGGMYHPSGLDADDECVWLAAAHYRQLAASSLVMCVDPATLAVKRSFLVEDHIGALAAAGDRLLLINWDARDVYIYGKDGGFLRRQPSSSPNGTAYQDCAGVDGRTALCSGPGKAGGDGPAAFVDTLVLGEDDSISFLPARAVANPETGLGREGFDYHDGWWLFLPEDFPGARLLMYGPRETGLDP